MKWGLCLKVSAVLVVLVAIAAQFFGVFHTVVWEEGSIEERRMLYLDYQGPMSGVGDTFMKIGEWVCGDKCDMYSRTTVGIYLDDPKVVPEAELRSLIGVFAESDAEIESVQKAHPEVKLKVIKAQEGLKTWFPMVTQLGSTAWTGSLMIALSKVYPALEAYGDSKSVKCEAVMEIYDTPNKRFEYFAFRDPFEPSVEKANAK